ncbi:MAG: metalloregulator ArsR/SmtB family transcription factor [Nitrososphaerota archaeon]|nr:metalloregulator ArsR/SmtB family transcription factor [Nitrososphaerota archaeon]
MARLKRSTRARVGKLSQDNPSRRIRELRDSLRFAKEGKNVPALERLGKGLSDDTRMCILSLLKTYGDLAATELVAALDISQPAVTKHMQTLVESRLVRHHRSGRWTTYSLNPRAAGLVLSEDPSAPPADGPGTGLAPLSKTLRSRMERLTEGEVDERVRRLRETVRAIRDHEDRPLSRRLTMAISDKTRLLMLALINMHEELTATELAAALNVSHATVSEHIRLLAGFVKGTPRGKWVYYSMDNPQLAGMLPVRLSHSSDGRVS